MLPAPTNDSYPGPLWAVYALLLAAAHSFIGGALYVLLPDSGLISIAGLNLAHEGGLLMVALAAWGGATQIVWGATLGVVALRYRNFTAPFLALVVIEKALILLSQAIKPTNGDDMLPGLTAALVLLLICLVALIATRLVARQIGQQEAQQVAGEGQRPKSE